MNDTHHEVVVGDEQTPDIPSGTDERADDEADYDSDNECKEFFFESDHLALRGNPDYTSVLRTIAILQTQRIQISKDFDRLAQAERDALDDPEAFIQKLARGELQMPTDVTAIELPKIDFAKYGVDIPDFMKDEPKVEQPSELNVRGRFYDNSKPETFNQLWTCEEQKRLEELLIEYPPEPVEMRRFAKIARALGNRTKRQVASRLQKYFKKLYSAGMPVPGRVPKSMRPRMTKSSRITKQALRPTTFFPANQVPFTITEDDDCGIPLDPNWYRRGCSATTAANEANANGMRRTYVVDDGEDDDDDDDDDGGGVSDTDTLKLRLLMRLKRDKDKDARVDRITCEHDGFKCDLCTEEPIVGSRWHCTDCTETSVDFCSDCMITQIQSDQPRHTITHKFVALRVSSVAMTTDASSRMVSDDNSDDDDVDEDEDSRDDGGGGGDDVATSSKGHKPRAVYDKDYLLGNFTQQDYNYLDPNFLPQ